LSESNSLQEYRRRRDFTQTSEPRGDRNGEGAQRRYAIQKHAARQLHYDLRLELGGVLKSWAVPKGPNRRAPFRPDRNGCTKSSTTANGCSALSTAKRPAW